MKKFLLFVVIVLGIAGFWMVGQYNSLVSGRAGVDAAWSNVEVQYQRRADIVPQLVATVEGAANFEKKTLTEIVEARSKATQVKVDPTNAESIKAFTASQGQLSGALSRLLVSVEAYPTLTATQGFRDLQSQLEGTENRIAVARGDYNGVANSWNVKISRVPTVFIARLMGFEKAALFDAQPGTENAPKVEFNLDK
jgi:LemA protein